MIHLKHTRTLPSVKRFGGAQRRQVGIFFWGGDAKVPHSAIIATVTQCDSESYLKYAAAHPTLNAGLQVLSDMADLGPKDEDVRRPDAVCDIALRICQILV